MSQKTKTKRANMIALIIGLISTALGIYLMISGSSFKEYFFSLLFGFSLTGVAYMNISDQNNETE